METEDGLKPIEEIQVGDKVLSYDEQTGEQAYKEVVRLFRNQTKEWYHVFVHGEEIVCTGGHPFYVLNATEDRNAVNYVGAKESNGKWICAKDLKTSDTLLLSNGTQTQIYAINIENLEEPETTYNFEVAEFHTYYVTDNKVLVHNRCVAKEGKYRAAVRVGGDPNHAVGHAHIYNGSMELASVLDDGTVVAGKLKGKALDFVKNHIDEINEGINRYYYIGRK